MEAGKLERAVQGLKWEAKYRKHSKGESVGNAFLKETVELDEDFAQAFQKWNIPAGTLLDIGTGMGWQAIQFARLGHQVTATDVSSTCIDQAVQKASVAGVEVRFRTDNVLSSSLDERFDVVTDRGCFTVLKEDLLSGYAAQVARLSRPEGWFLLKVDRKKEKHLDYLLEKFKLVEKIHSTYVNAEEKPVKALFCVLRPLR